MIWLERRLRLRLRKTAAQTMKPSATIDEAQGKVDQSEAMLRKAEANLGYTTIRSPIHGVVIDRRVNIGQTVVSSLNAPSLFLIAKDLSRLQVWASVNEADIGRLAPGQRVTFSVDADAPFVRVQVQGTSRVSDHRLRIGFRSALSSPRVMADAMFGPVPRAMPAVSPSDAEFERPHETQPLHRYVTASADALGFTTFSDGLAEYGVAPDGTTFVTLVRSVGELSRNDMPERPGHAGWPTPTPEAQCHGPFEAAFAAATSAPHAVACSNGTAALHLAYAALGLRAGDERLALERAARLNLAVRVSEKRYFLPGDVERLVGVLTALAGAGGEWDEFARAIRAWPVSELCFALDSCNRRRSVASASLLSVATHVGCTPSYTRCSYISSERM